jgi:hypothetical protein
MQQRRKAPSSASLVLPVTTEDSKMGKRTKRDDGYAFCGPKFWSVMVLIVMALLVVFCIQQFTSPPTSPSLTERGLKPLPLSQFPTLNKAFAQAELVGLYFAASWCPMSTGPTNLLGDIFGDLLVSDPSKFALVYVSSDKDQESMEQYMKPNWIAVPFDSTERTALKKHFSVCAQKEMAELEIDRKYEIPSLFLFDGESHGLLSTHGVKDLAEHPSLEVYELWKGTQRVVRGLSEKYLDE